MKRFFPDASVRDIGRALRGCSISINKEEVYVEDVLDYNILYVASNEDPYELKLESEDDIIIAYPPTGYFEYEDSWLYIQRIPSRQWSAGITASNSRFQAGTQEHIGHIHPLKFTKIIGDCRRFVPQSFNNILTQMQDPCWTGNVITRDIVLYKDPFYKDPVISYKSKRIGCVRGEVLHISDIADYVIQTLPEEIQDSVELIQV